MLKVKERFFNIIFLNVYVSTEQKYVDVIESFYDTLEEQVAEKI